jgi:hypothetical protein
LRGEKYDEIKLISEFVGLIDELIKILSLTEVLIEKKNCSDYTLLKLNLNNTIIKYEIYNGPFRNYIMRNRKHISSVIYFTCDNLAINYNGTIDTIIPSYSIEYDRIIQSINNAVLKKFSILDLRDNYGKTVNLRDNENISFLIDINQKYNEMIEHGFTYVANVNDVIFKNHKDINQYSERDISVSCSICREDYCDDHSSDTVLLKCLHDFHINCLLTWIKTNNKCPLCRVDIDFEPQTQYGDNVIDNIIENYQE